MRKKFAMAAYWGAAHIPVVLFACLALVLQEPV